MEEAILEDFLYSLTYTVHEDYETKTSKLKAQIKDLEESKKNLEESL